VKNDIDNQGKKSSPLLNLFLFLISVFLLLITGPLGFIYGVGYTILRKGFQGLGAYFLEIAISIDQLGNVLMQHLLNALWLKKGAYPFGNRDETISSALGRNKKLNTLNPFGNLIDKVLDAIDPNHSLNSIDQHIEPSKDVLDVVTWIHIKEQHILCTRSENKKVYYIPGGKKEWEETKEEALIREIKEELNIDLIKDSLSPVGTFEGPAEGYPSGVMVRLHCFFANYVGELCPSSEIKEMAWLSYRDIKMVAETDQLIFEFLKKKNWL
jgi:ADP-ribose pyrophosphatase YjhB (NUDIX family)